MFIISEMFYVAIDCIRAANYYKRNLSRRNSIGTYEEQRLARIMKFKWSLSPNRFLLCKTADCLM